MAFAIGSSGCRIWYETTGAGNPLLLIPGQSIDHRMWNVVRPTLEERHRVVVYDNRGSGQSDGPLAPPYSMELFAADVISVLDAAGIGRAHIYGISMGGRIAQRLAIDHADRVGAVILGATTPGDRHGVRRSAEVDDKFRVMDPAERFRLLIDEMYTSEWQAAHPEAVEELRTAAMEPKQPELLKLHYEASQGHEAWEELPSIKAPVLVIHGTDDSVNPTANARLLAERIPGAELRLVTGARHAYQAECHPEATIVVLEFLARHPF
jgi:3-oxoadipate enol-lactonase